MKRYVKPTAEIVEIEMFGLMAATNDSGVSSNGEKVKAESDEDGDAWDEGVAKNHKSLWEDEE